MTTPTATRLCRFPGCKRPAVDASGTPGRPPEYCDDPDHTAVKAWRVRRAGGVEPDSEDFGRPVAMASARAGMLRDELTGTVAQLVDQMQRIVGDLQTMTDPDAAAAQIETVTSEATEQVAAAEGARSRAEASARQARSEREEADAAAADLEEQLTRVQAELTAAGEQRDLDRAELDQRATQIDDLTGQLGETRSELAASQASAAQAAAEVATLTESLVAARAAADQAGARAEELEQKLAASLGRAEQLGEQLAETRAQADSQRAENSRLDAQLAAAAQRADDAVARADRADAAHEQAERDHAAADRAGAKLEAQLDQARTRLAELADERAQLTSALTATIDRAARAEALAGTTTGPADQPASTGRKPRAPRKATTGRAKPRGQEEKR